MDPTSQGLHSGGQNFTASGVAHEEISQVLDGHPLSVNIVVWLPKKLICTQVLLTGA